MWGDGYSNANDIWWRQLDRELKRRGYHDVEIVAAGLNGASTQDQLRWLRELDLVNDVHADLVILGYVTNDPEVKAPNGEYYIKQIGRDVPLPTWDLLNSTVGRLAPTIVSQLKAKLSEKWASQVKDAYRYREWQLKLLDSPNIDEYAEIVGDLGAYLSEIDVPIFAVSLPHYPSAEHFQPRHRPIKPIFRGRRHSFLRFGRPVLQRVRKRRKHPHLGYQSGQRPSRAHCHSFLCSPGGGYSRAELLRHDRAAFRRCSAHHAADQ